MKRRDFVKLCASSLAMGAANVPSISSAQEKMVWKASDVHPLGYPTVEAVQRMGKKLETATNGRISIQMYPLMQLGGEKEMIEQAQVGALQIARISVGAMGPVVDDLNVFNLPFIFRDEAHMRKVIDGPIGQELLERVSNSPHAADRARLDGCRHAQRLLQQADHQARGFERDEDPHDGQPDLRRDHERHGRQRNLHGVQRAVRRAADGGGGRRREQPADAARAEPLYGQQGVQPHRPPDHSRDLRVLEAQLGNAFEGGSGAAQEGLARGAVRGARVVGQDGGRRRRQAAGVQFVEADKAAFYKATQPVRDKYGAKYAALLKRIEDTK